MKVKFNTYLELEVEVIAHVSPAVPPRPCSDPDSPAYSDPGDPGGCEIEAVILIGKNVRKDITQYLFDHEIKHLEEQAEDVAKDKAEEV